MSGGLRRRSGGERDKGDRAVEHGDQGCPHSKPHREHRLTGLAKITAFFLREQCQLTANPARTPKASKVPLAN